MIVFNLACEHDHRFEGWFASADDHASQVERGLLECPMCGSRAVRKTPSAPRLNLSGAREAPAPAPATSGAGPQPVAMMPSPERLQALWLEVARRIVAGTEDVGSRFAEEARRIHYEEAPERGIRGTATPEEAEALREEGIDVFAFPLPRAAEDPLQ